MKHPVTGQTALGTICPMSDRRKGRFDRIGGPNALPANAKRKTYLIAFIDDATRVIPYCAFALAENTCLSGWSGYFDTVKPH